MTNLPEFRGFDNHLKIWQTRIILLYCSSIAYDIAFHRKTSTNQPTRQPFRGRLNFSSLIAFNFNHIFEITNKEQTNE